MALAFNGNHRHAAASVLGRELAGVLLKNA
jgi:hypothetical protein